MEKLIRSNLDNLATAGLCIATAAAPLVVLSVSWPGARGLALALCSLLVLLVLVSSAGFAYVQRAIARDVAAKGGGATELRDGKVVMEKRTHHRKGFRGYVPPGQDARGRPAQDKPQILRSELRPVKS